MRPTMQAVRVETLVELVAAQRPAHLALCFGERRWTYGALRTELDRSAAVLIAAGLPAGAVVATTEYPTDDLAITFLACCRADLTLFVLSPALTPVEATPLLARSHAQVLLTADGSPHVAQPAVPTLPLSLPGSPDSGAVNAAAHRSTNGSAEAIAAIYATSGTTGSSAKLACLSHRYLTWRWETPAWWETADDVYYSPQRNLFLAYELCGVLGRGATMVLSHATHPEQLEAEMTAHHATVLTAVPPMIRLLAEQTPPPLPGLSLRAIRTGTASLSPEIAQAISRRYHAPLVETYASTEGGGMMETAREGGSEGSIGTPYPGIEARIVDDTGTDVGEGATGEVLIHSPGLMSGYLDAPDLTAQVLQDGWLWTGDLARRDANGCYHLEGRRALRINVGGFKVAPEEVEAVLALYPGVREVVVLAAVDAARGEIVRAVIVPEGDPPLIADLRAFCRERLSGYKVPRVWEFRTDLPRSPLGKVLRSQV